MSAIFGIINYDNRIVSQSDLDAMYHAMAHRGPDSKGCWSEGAAGLGHGLFRTLPESKNEKLPYKDQESGLLITADARIDNRTELAMALGLDRNKLSELTDSYLILSAFKKWGNHCINYLLGDFSFAIWNEKQKNLFCARDHMGIKPFNYYHDGSTFVFASEAQAISKAPGVFTQYNEPRIADSVVTELEGYDLSSTFYQNIFRLPPAHTLSIQNGNLSKQSYWTPDPDKRIVLGSDREYVEAFTEIYTDAIDKRMRGNDNVASMLSGGMDSSSIVGIARKLHQTRTGKPFPVYSAISSGQHNCRDTYFINSVLGQGGLTAHTVSIEELTLLNDEVSRIVNSALEPFDPMIMIIALYLRAQQSGCRVMLDGIDGDIIGSLSPAYPATLLRNKLYREAIQEMTLQNKNYYNGRSSTAKIIYQNLRSAYTPSLIKKLKRPLNKIRARKRSNTSVLNSAFAKEVFLTDRLQQLGTNEDRPLSGGSIQSTHSLHASTTMAKYLTVAVERYDRTAALCKIEPRHPLLDKRVIEFMIAIPWEQKVRLGWSKYLLRKSSEDYLTQEVCWRQGWEHIGWDFEKEWLSLNLDNISKTINRMLDIKKSYFNVSQIKSIISQSSRGSSTMTAESAETLLKLHHLGNWLERQE